MPRSDLVGKQSPDLQTTAAVANELLNAEFRLARISNEHCVNLSTPARKDDSFIWLLYAWTVHYFFHNMGIKGV